MGISITINAANATEAQDEMRQLLGNASPATMAEMMKGVVPSAFDPAHVHAGAGVVRDNGEATDTGASSSGKPSFYKGQNAADISERIIAASKNGPLSADDEDDLNRLPKALLAKTRAQVDLELMKAGHKEPPAPAEPEVPAATADSLLDDAVEYALYDCGGDTIDMHPSLDAWRVGFVEHLADIHDGDQVKQFCQNNAEVANQLTADDKAACNKAAEARLIQLSPPATEPTTPAAAGAVDATAVRKVLAEAIDKKGIEKCAEILKEFDANKFSELKPEHYAAFVAKCNEAMAA